MAAKKRAKKVVKQVAPSENPYHSPDGITRSRATEKQINEAFAIVFDGSSAADLVFNYLRGVTIERVSGPGVDGESLLHIEGQRYIVGIIDQRAKLGREKKP